MNPRPIFTAALTAALLFWGSATGSFQKIRPILHLGTPRVNYVIDPNRTIELDDAIDLNTAKNITDELAMLDQDGLPITIRISSPGGEIIPGIQIIKAIQNTRSPVTCVVDVYAASMAAFIFMGCPNRVMHKYGILMFHEYAADMTGTRKEIKSRLQMVEAIFNSLVEELIRQSGLSREVVLKHLSEDWWLNAGDAAKLRFVDAIVDHYVTISSKPAKPVKKSGKAI